jgi:hypothetical protein
MLRLKKAEAEDIKFLKQFSDVYWYCKGHFKLEPSMRKAELAKIIGKGILCDPEYMTLGNVETWLLKIVLKQIDKSDDNIIELIQEAKYSLNSGTNETHLMYVLISTIRDLNREHLSDSEGNLWLAPASDILPRFEEEST